MNAIKGVVKDGRIVVAVPAAGREACEVVIEPVPARPRYGMREEDWPTTPEGIAALLTRMDQIEPLEMTPEEEVELAAWRQTVKEYHIVNWDRWARKIEGLFE